MACTTEEFSNRKATVFMVATMMSEEQIKRLLSTEPTQAEAHARKALAAQPDNAGATWLLGAALRRQGDGAGARVVLETLVQHRPHMAAAGLELGLALRDLDMHEAAIAVLRQTLDLAPNYADAWYLLGDELEWLGNDTGNRTNLIERNICGSNDPQFRAAVEALRMGRLEFADGIAKQFLETQPANSCAIKLCADAAFLSGRFGDAETLLSHCLELAPDFMVARFQFAITLLVQKKGHKALGYIELLEQGDPANEVYRDLEAMTLLEIESFDRAAELYEQIIEKSPNRPGAWLAYGRALRGRGQIDQCIIAFRKAIEILPTFIDAYWSLATVKTFRFDLALMGALQAQITRPELSPKERAQMHFALGKALEDLGQFGESFDHYLKSNTIQRVGVESGAISGARLVKRCRELFTADFFRERTGAGRENPDPIFIVGLPRSGSSLVEQILSSHPAIEGLGELPDLALIVAGLDNEAKHAATSLRYPEMLRTLEHGRFALLAEEYLNRVGSRRSLGCPFFTDKFLGNFAQIGLIHLLLPNARIVDVRRHPLDCCLSCFKNYFPQSPTFYRTLDDLGRHYASYVELMAHFDEVLPGSVHRLIYEDLIGDPEKEIRRLLDNLGLPFEQECLFFHEKARPVTTLSSEQVRMPLYTSAMGYWRNFEPWLGPLKETLGPVLDVYPDVPKYNFRMQYSISMRLT